MPCYKPVIFVSHAALDAALANSFKDDVEAAFLGMCSLFVSSSLDSINAGSEWITQIKKTLSEASIIVGLLSPVAIQRGWVYFEFGAGWIKDIPVIPVCHSGLTRENLPPPLSTFQALNLSDELHLSHLFGQIADAISCQKPAIDFKILADKYRVLGEKTTRDRLISGWLAQLIEWNPTLPKLFSEEIDECEIMTPSNLDAQFLQFAREAEAAELVKILPKGMAMGTRVGAQATISSATRLAKFADAVTPPSA